MKFNKLFVLTFLTLISFMPLIKAEQSCVVVRFPDNNYLYFWVDRTATLSDIQDEMQKELLSIPEADRLKYLYLSDKEKKHLSYVPVENKIREKYLSDLGKTNTTLFVLNKMYEIQRLGTGDAGEYVITPDTHVVPLTDHFLRGGRSDVLFGGQTKKFLYLSTSGVESAADWKKWHDEKGAKTLEYLFQIIGCIQALRNQAKDAKELYETCDLICTINAFTNRLKQINSAPLNYPRLFEDVKSWVTATKEAVHKLSVSERNEMKQYFNQSAKTYLKKFALPDAKYEANPDPLLIEQQLAADYAVRLKFFNEIGVMSDTDTSQGSFLRYKTPLIIAAVLAAIPLTYVGIKKAKAYLKKREGHRLLALLRREMSTHKITWEEYRERRAKIVKDYDLTEEIKKEESSEKERARQEQITVHSGQALQ